MSPSAKQLADTCRDRLGDALRTVTVYDEEGFETVYVRDDLRSDYSRQRFASLVAIARDIHRPLSLFPGQDSDNPIGGYRSSVHDFGNVRVLQVLATPKRGFLVSVDSASAERLEEVKAVVDRLRSSARRG